MQSKKQIPDKIFQLCHGGELRKKSKGRKARPLEVRKSLHVVFRCNRICLVGGLRYPKPFALCNKILKKYAVHFSVIIDHFTIQKDHIHLLVRAESMDAFRNFFRVVAGQIAQQLQNLGFAKKQVLNASQEKRASKYLRVWMLRPWTRIIIGNRAFQVAYDYVRINELEGAGIIPYQKNRTKGISSEELDRLWAIYIAGKVKTKNRTSS